MHFVEQQSFLKASPAAGGRTVSSWAFEELSRRIIVGELGPDSSVTEEGLVKELGVSRTPLRDAIKQLEDLGLIVRQRNRTLKIAPLQTREILELVMIREHLEGLVVREVTRRLSLGEISVQDLKDVVKRLEIVEREPNQADLIFKLGAEFHSQLLELSQLGRVKRMLYGIQLGLARYRHVNATDQRRLIQRSDEHRRILEAIESGDMDAAEAQMRRHIREGLKAYTSNTGNGPADPASTT